MGNIAKVPRGRAAVASMRIPVALADMAGAFCILGTDR